MDEEHVKVTETTTQSDPVEPGTVQQTKRVTTSTGGAPSGLVIAERFVYAVVGIIETLLAFRLVLSLLGANHGNQFADFVFTTTEPFVQPFLNLFNYQTAYGVSRLELETVVAMAVYAVVGAIITMLLRLPRRPVAGE